MAPPEKSGIHSRLNRWLGRFWEGTKNRTLGQFTVRPHRVKHDTIAHHAVLIDHLGMAVPIVNEEVKLFRRHDRDEPRSFPRQRRQLSDAAYRKYVNRMMSELEKAVKAGECPKGVVLIVHGGNEAPSNTLKASIEMLPLIKKDKLWPIFINWNSSILSAYLEQVFRIRSGTYKRRAPFTGIGYFLGDLVNGLARLLPALGTSAKLLLRCVRKRPAPGTEREKLKELEHPPNNIRVWLGDWKPKTLLSRAVWRVLATPGQVISTYVISVLVPRAWGNLLRRTRAVFRAPREFDENVRSENFTPPPAGRYAEQGGALAQLLRALTKKVRELDVKVTLIAHSMGSMITNDIVRFHPDLPYKAIVYMAPACNIRSFNEAVLPALPRQAPRTRAYVLNLHPKVEAWQRDFYCLAPIGSVLEWLEGFLEPPHAYLDRMLGKWENVIPTLHVIDDAVRPRLVLKGFPFEGPRPKMPYMHVHFNDPSMRFWRKAFWHPPLNTRPDRGKLATPNPQP